MRTIITKLVGVVAAVWLTLASVASAYNGPIYSVYMFAPNGVTDNAIVTYVVELERGAILINSENLRIENIKTDNVCIVEAQGWLCYMNNTPYATIYATVTLGAGVLCAPNVALTVTAFNTATHARVQTPAATQSVCKVYLPYGAN